MIFIINTSGAGLEFVLDDHHKSLMVEKQSLALPAAAESFLAECGATWRDITAIGVVIGLVISGAVIAVYFVSQKKKAATKTEE